MRPTTEATEIKVTSPFDSDCSMPAKVKSPGSMLASIRAVYGARAISSTNKKMGFAYPIRIAKMELRAIRCQGFSASVIGPPNTRNSCHTVIMNINAQAKY